MGKIIGGVVVGLIASWIAAAILMMVLAAILGADGIRDVGTKAPTTTWLAIVLIVTGATAYLGGAICRAIGKSKNATYAFMGLVIVLSLVSFAFQGAAQQPPQQEMPEDPPAFLQAMMAMGEAQMNMPKWLMFVSPLLSLFCIALGGLNKSDFGSPAAPADAA